MLWWQKQNDTSSAVSLVTVTTLENIDEKFMSLSFLGHHDSIEKTVSFLGFWALNPFYGPDSSLPMLA
jgi:hypothetical protein